jgi:hypothetical protein
MHSGSRASLEWTVVLAALLLCGCAGTAQSLKGKPEGLAVADEEAVRAAFLPKRLALVIGINAFQDRNWNPLKFAVKDAEDMAAVLSDPRYGRFDQVKVLTGPEETTREGILEAVQELSRRNLSADDTVFLYISSHGTLSRTQQGRLHHYLVAQDTRLNDVNITAIDLTELKKEFNRLKSRKKVMIFAFCHSGQGKSQINESVQAELAELKAPFFVKPMEAVSEATVVLTASAWGETAREDRNLENDIYTHFLIEGIKGQDRNGDGAVTVTEAHDYAKEQTYYFTKGEQRPSMESVILGSDPIILSGEVVRKGKPVLYDYSQRYRDMEVVINGEKKGILPGSVALEPGIQRVALVPKDGTDPLYEESVRVQEGESLSIPILLYGYDQSLSVRLGYQGFLDSEVNRSVAKPLVAYGLVYTHQTLFSPQVGLRADVSYGQDRQNLDVGSITVDADISQFTYGAALLYRYPTRWAAWYAGPRLGGLYLTRELDAAPSSREGFGTVTPGGIVGLHLRYKQHVSLTVESTFNYANIELNETDTRSVYYNLFGGLSVNF